MKKLYFHLVPLIVFILLTSIYFAPSIFHGKIIWQSDMQKVYGMSTDLDKYYKKGGNILAWTGQMFSGMPSYQIRVLGNPKNYLEYLEKPIKAIDYFGASMILTALICFYILMYVTGVKRELAIAGAIAFAFTSYNLIIISVGHITKMYVIAYMPLTIAGLIVLFKNKRIDGMILFLLGICFSILNNHIQITYYLFLFCLFIFTWFIYFEIKQKKYLSLVKVIGIIIFLVIIAMLPSLGNLYSNYEISQESTRGRSNLISLQKDTKGSSGLDRDYAFSWSYGKGELLTLLIPNAYGGASMGILDNHSEFYKMYNFFGGKARKFIQAPTYWGEQPFTSGPVYFGAVVCFLFVLGMFVVQDSLKWWIVAGSIFFIFLSLGKNCMALNAFLFRYLPFYNKFRTPSMSLVIPSMTFPLIAFWGLAKIVQKNTDFHLIKKHLMYSFIITGGICFLIWILPSVFLEFSSIEDISHFAQFPPQLVDALETDREKMASLDAFRSLVFIVLIVIFLFLFFKFKNKRRSEVIFSIAVLLLITVDLWGVGKRYLNYQSFTQQHFSESYSPTFADLFILKDHSLSYRVLNMSVNTFNETHTSFFHQSVGGYHASKLKRYQELIDCHILNEMKKIHSAFNSIVTLKKLQHVFENTSVLNMLNVKYLIFNPNKVPIVNLLASGNVWFVNKYIFVSNANQEMKKLHEVNLKETAIVNNNFASYVKIKQFIPDSTASIRLVKYEPNDLKYVSFTNFDQLAIFSEIYYKNGWKSFIDHVPVEHFRVDWILRAMIIPPGEHEIEFRFEPNCYCSLEKIASVSSLIILILILGFLITVPIKILV